MIARRSLIVAALAAFLPGTLAAQATTAKPPAKPKAAAAPKTAKPAPGAPTTARQVIDAHIAAIGGREALLARKSSRAVMTMEMPAAGMRADMEVASMAPNKILVKTTIPGMGELLSGYDGTTAWAVDPMQGARVLSGKELDQARTQADFNGELRPDSLYSAMELVEKTEFEGRPAWKVRLVRKTGQEVREYFDAETGLLLGSQMTVETAMGPVEATSVFQEYKAMGGMKVPVRSLQRVNGQELVLTVVSMDTNTVDPSVFELPAQIRALVPAK